MDQQQPELALEQHQHHKTTKLVRWGEPNDSTLPGGRLPRVRSMEETLPSNMDQQQLSWFSNIISRHSLAGASLESATWGREILD